MKFPKQQGKIIPLSILFASLASLCNAEPLPSKPFKVCPELVTAKDTPCRVINASAALAQRMEIPPEKVKSTKEKIIYIDNPALLERIRVLEEELAALKAAPSTGRPKVDVEKPTNTRAIRG